MSLMYTAEVQQYSVWKKDAKTGEDFIGYCYLDLFPRSKARPFVEFPGTVFNRIVTQLQSTRTLQYGA